MFWIIVCLSEGEFYESQRCYIGNHFERVCGIPYVASTEDSRSKSFGSTGKQACAKRFRIKETHRSAKVALASERGQDPESYRSVESGPIRRSQRDRRHS